MICVKRNLPKLEVTVPKKKKRFRCYRKMGEKKKFNNTLLK